MRRRPSNAPSAAIAFARDAGLTGKRVFNHYGFGGYLISVGIPTFVDGRGELYGGDFIKRQVEAVACAARSRSRPCSIAMPSTGRC